MLILQRPWTRQPPGVPDLRGNWRGVVGTSLLGNHGLASDGSAIVTVGTVGKAPTTHGIASSHAAGTNMLRAVIRNSAIGVTSGVGAGLLGIFRTTSTATDGRIVSLGSDQGSGGNTLFSIGINNSALRVTMGGSGTAVAAEATAVGINDGRLHCVVLTVDAFSTGTANFKAWLDGRLVITSSVSSIGVNSLYNYIVANGFRRGGTDSAGIAGDVLLAMPFHRQLNDSEALAISTVENAFGRLFAPIRIPIPTAAAAASSLPTLSASTYVPGSLTSTGWRPRVTAQF